MICRFLTVSSNSVITTLTYSQRVDLNVDDACICWRIQNSSNSVAQSAVNTESPKVDKILSVSSEKIKYNSN
jgi:DNA polymerase III psi subunit